MNTCEKLQQEYEKLKSLKKEFEVAYLAWKEAKTPEEAKENILRVKELKAILEQKRDALREKIDPYSDWQSYKSGETISHYDGRWDSWWPHPQGVVIEKGNQLLLNGTKLLYNGKWDSWWPHPKGVVIQKGNQFFLNGTELLYDRKWSSSFSHPKGVVIEEGDQLLLNGTELLYRKGWNYWWPHFEVIQKGNQLLLNGTELLYEGKWDDWKPYPKGVVIKKGNDWIFYNESRKY